MNKNLKTIANLRESSNLNNVGVDAHIDPKKQTYNKYMSNNVGVDDPVDPNKQKYINKPTSNVPTSNIQHLTSNVAITLIALIITIIVLLILAGVTLNMVMGDSGLISKAQLAKEETENAQIKENAILDGYVNEIDYIVGNRENENSIVYYKMSELDTSANPYNLEGYISYKIDTGVLCLNFYDKSVSAIANASKILDLNNIKELGKLNFERNSNESVTNNNDSYFLAGAGMCVARNMATNYIKNK